MNGIEKKPIVGLLFLFFIVIGIWIVSMLIIHFGPFFSTLNEKGLFGDSFGSINALFSGLAFAGVIYAIILQREELRLQREELRLTREELKRSADAHEESKRALIEQAQTQSQSAKLAAYTALLNWEIREKETGGGGFLSGGSPELYVDKIEAVLLEIEPDEKNA